MFQSNHLHTDRALITIAVWLGVTELMIWFDRSLQDKIVGIRLVYLICLLSFLLIQSLKTYTASCGLYKSVILIVVILTTSLKLTEVIVLANNNIEAEFDP